MPAVRISMRKFKELMRLKFEAKLSHRQIGRSLSMSPGTVSRYVQQWREAGLTWPLSEGLSDGAGFVQLVFELGVALAQLFQFTALCRLQVRLRAALVVRARLQCSLAT